MAAAALLSLVLGSRTVTLDPDKPEAAAEAIRAYVADQTTQATQALTAERDQALVGLDQARGLIADQIVRLRALRVGEGFDPAAFRLHLVGDPKATPAVPGLTVAQMQFELDSELAASKTPAAAPAAPGTTPATAAQAAVPGRTTSDAAAPAAPTGTLDAATDNRFRPRPQATA